MPGFDYHFACKHCDAKSHSYPCFVFSHLGYGWIRLPAWSLKYRCWSDISLDLSLAQRQALEGDPKKMIAFAESLSSASLTVGAVFTDFSEEPFMKVIPAPQCPLCHDSCQVVFAGRESHSEIAEPTLGFDSAEGFDKTLVSDFGFSVRTRNILWSLGKSK